MGRRPGPRCRRAQNTPRGGDRLDRVAARRDALFLVEGRGRYDPYARDAQRHEDQQHPVRQTGRGALRKFNFSLRFTTVPTTINVGGFIFSFIATS